MSEIARWSYKNTATVKPLVSAADWDNPAVYGTEYEIACNWIAESTQQRDSNGNEFVSRHIIYTEDARPKYLDMIKLSGQDEFEEIRSKTEWDMNMFDDVPDYKLVT